MLLQTMPDLVVAWLKDYFTESYVEESYLLEGIH